MTFIDGPLKVYAASTVTLACMREAGFRDGEIETLDGPVGCLTMLFAACSASSLYSFVAGVMMFSGWEPLTGP